ncbi:MAG: phosphatase PAP2 family protein [Metallibacterium scheffleri]|jgi:undecaprenyl-diphosphatase|uniref:undecaprenyl-diphosphate phosphatase n=1 Tax=Metallibacterium scheffleri TaxID=993689 RepID=A0A4S3KN65_9GAMM|nr:phosphatase PAP2 family protein [Metallibacterium scheffleri]THD10395.1 phosphatase PAP2 family protein [Metallibacterium scheffleri]
MANPRPLDPPHQPLGLRLCLRANRWGAQRVVGSFFRFVSRLGDGVFWYALMAALSIFGGERGLRATVEMAATGLLALALYYLLKRWTQRPRPFRSVDGIVAHVPPLDEFSFPSGHTLQAVSFSLIASAWFPMLIPLLLVFTLLVAASRIVLGLHYPSDVLAASGIGLLLGGGALALGSMLGLGL